MRSVPDPTFGGPMRAPKGSTSRVPLRRSIRGRMSVPPMPTQTAPPAAHFARARDPTLDTEDLFGEAVRREMEHARRRRH